MNWFIQATLGPIALVCGTVGVITARMTSVESFVALRFVQGLTAMGVFTNAFVWSIEVVGGKWQTIIGIGWEAPWATRCGIWRGRDSPITA
jgi:hypothetical protein